MRRALIAQNLDTSSGEVHEGKRRWAVRTLGQFRSPEQVEAVMACQMDYLRFIGAVGREADEDESPAD